MSSFVGLSPTGDLSKFELHQNILLPVPNTWISGMALKLFGFLGLSP